MEVSRELFYRVKREDVYMYQNIFESYDNVAIVSAYESGDIIRILTTCDFEELVMNILNSVKEELIHERLSDGEAEKVKYWFLIREGRDA